MKLLTLNTHSLVEDNYPQKLEAFVKAVFAERPSVIALQEVNQSADMAEIRESAGYTSCRENVVIREDNHVYRAAEMLREKGLEYYWTWLPLKRGYDRYDEGLALMSLSPIAETDIVQISSADDYSNWKTRKILGIRTGELPDEWFFSVHYGWWNDPEEPFLDQWIKTCIHMKKYESVWLMGDFNSPAEVRDEGYDIMKKSYWHDSYELAERKDSGVTVRGKIDGWSGEKSMRIDQIWCRKRAVVTSSKVVFNGESYPIVSDHYGVMINYEKSII